MTLPYVPLFYTSVLLFSRVLKTQIAFSAIPKNLFGWLIFTGARTSWKSHFDRRPAPVPSSVISLLHAL